MLCINKQAHAGGLHTHSLQCVHGQTEQGRSGHNTGDFEVLTVRGKVNAMHQQASTRWRASPFTPYTCRHLTTRSAGFHLRWLPLHLEVLAQLQVIVADGAGYCHRVLGQL